MNRDQVKNVGYQTDLMVLGADANFSSHGGALVIRCPANPSYFWGNLLLFPRAPAADAVKASIASFHAAMAGAGLKHVTIGWDDPAGDAPAIAAFEALGFTAERGTVLTTAEAVVGRGHDFEIRAPESDADWEALLVMQLDSSEQPYPRAFRETYQRARNVLLRQAIKAGRAVWRCVWVDGQPVGSMGLYAGAGLGRFQEVQTHPDFRRRGICSALLVATAQAGRELGAERLVIVSDSGSVAEQIYRQHGFEIVSPTHGVCLAPS